MGEPDDDGGELLLAALRLEPMHQTSMPVAPRMERSLGYVGFRRYVAFTRTQLGLVYWTDGIDHGLSVVAVLDRFLKHPLILPHLAGCRLQSRAVEPEELTMFESLAEALKIELEELGDAILLDREMRMVWTGSLARAHLHLMLATACEEFPDKNDVDADNPKTVDDALQMQLLGWLDGRLKGAPNGEDIERK